MFSCRLPHLATPLRSEKRDDARWLDDLPRLARDMVVVPRSVSTVHRE